MSENQDIQGVLDRLAEVEKQIKEMAGQDEKSLRLAVIIKFVVVCLVAAYLGWAYANVRTIDANLVVFTAVERVNEAIPTAKASY